MEKSDYDAAEAALKAALTADVMFGPAHNNLGKVYFHKGELYLAAREFDYAMKLMPNTIGRIDVLFPAEWYLASTYAENPLNAVRTPPPMFHPKSVLLSLLPNPDTSTRLL